MKDVTLAILTGGAGRRMGKPKAWLTINGVPILQHLHHRLAWRGPTMLVTVESREHPPAYELFDREVVDPMERGPLQSVATALTHSAATPFTVVIPVDMIQLECEHLRFLLERIASNPAVMFRRTSDQVEPLPLACRPGLREAIEMQMTRGDLSLRGLHASGIAAAVDVPRDWSDDIWSNLNTPEDLRRVSR